MEGSAFSFSIFLPLYNNKMPLSVINAGGPGSVRWLSNFFSLGFMATNNSCCSFITGVQSTRFSECARYIGFSPQYIQYLPFTGAAIIFLFTIFVTTDPDLLQVFKNLPLYAFVNAGPLFFQLIKSADVATLNLATSRFQLVYSNT